MQRTIQPGPPSKKSKYWKTSGILFAVFFLMIMLDVANDPSSFECNNGELIDPAFVNDGDYDCSDRSDEGTDSAYDSVSYTHLRAHET